MAVLFFLRYRLSMLLTVLTTPEIPLHNNASSFSKQSRDRFLNDQARLCDTTHLLPDKRVVIGGLIILEQLSVIKAPQLSTLEAPCDAGRCVKQTSLQWAKQPLPEFRLAQQDCQQEPVIERMVALIATGLSFPVGEFRPSGIRIDNPVLEPAAVGIGAFGLPPQHGPQYGVRVLIFPQHVVRRQKLYSAARENTPIEIDPEGIAAILQLGQAGNYVARAAGKATE